MLVAVDDAAESGATFAEHVEGSAVEAFVLVLFAQFDEAGDEGRVEGQWGDVAGGVDTEAVNTHFDEFAVALHEVVDNSGVLGVEVDAVAGNLTPPARGIVPVPCVGHVVPVVFVVVVLSVGVLEVFETFAILGYLTLVGQIPVACSSETLVVGDEAGGDIGLIADVLVAVEEVAEVVLAEVAGMLEHNVEDDFHAL